MGLDELEMRIDAILERDGRYRVEAYHFIIAALNFTMQRLGKEQHVSAAELLDGVREFGVDQFGPLTRTVFNHWGIARSSQFGDIVWNLIDAGVLGKRNQDRREDFDAAAFDLDTELSE